ncbi:hypothetical protein CF328_g9273, partial [Tilletia controversa]
MNRASRQGAAAARIAYPNPSATSSSAGPHLVFGSEASDIRRQHSLPSTSRQLSSTSNSLTHRSHTLPGGLPVANQSNQVVKTIPNSKKKPVLQDPLAGFPLNKQGKI